MKSLAKFHELPLTSIEPRGWLKTYLEKQRDGLTGHLEVAGPPFDSGGWTNPKIKTQTALADWWPYEQTAYWVDGMIRCGLLLQDEFLISKAKEQIDFVLDNPDVDGYLGPNHLKDPDDNNRWPHMVFFRALMAYHAATKDDRVVPRLTNHYLSGSAPHTYWRNVCNVEPILWVYEKTGDSRLLGHALEAFKGYNKNHPDADCALETLLSDEPATEHGVTFNETAKLGVIIFMYTGDETFLNATVNAYKKIDRDQLLVDGVCSSSERLQGKDPLDSHETCDIADFTWSNGYLLMATGDATYADKVERACFNAAPGAIKNDFKALQYFSCPNQVIADSASNHNLFNRGSAWMSYRPNPGTECCPGEVNRIMPNFAARMWMSDGQGGFVAAFYGPSQVTARVGVNNQEIVIIEETDYPFSDQISFRIQTDQPVEFTLWLRVPGWCVNGSLEINRQSIETVFPACSFVPIHRVFNNDDFLRLTLPMKIHIQHWPRSGITIERGPLVYSLKIEEDWQIDNKDKKSTPDFPAWNLYAKSLWNYALDLDLEYPDDDIDVVQKPTTTYPWSLDDAHIELHVPARRVKGWKICKKKKVTHQVWENGVKTEVETEGKFAFTPQLPKPKKLKKKLSKKVTLVPYGCTHLRITVLPHVEGPA